MMEARLPALFKAEKEYEVLDKFLGKSLEGKKYKPIFPYFLHVSHFSACDSMGKTHCQVRFRVVALVVPDEGEGWIHCGV